MAIYSRYPIKVTWLELQVAAFIGLLWQREGSRDVAPPGRGQTESGQKYSPLATCHLPPKRLPPHPGLAIKFDGLVGCFGRWQAVQHNGGISALCATTLDTQSASAMQQMLPHKSKECRLAWMLQWLPLPLPLLKCRHWICLGSCLWHILLDWRLSERSHLTVVWVMGQGQDLPGQPGQYDNNFMCS